jgi:hypothetical protein
MNRKHKASKLIKGGVFLLLIIAILISMFVITAPNAKAISEKTIYLEGYTVYIHEYYFIPNLEWRYVKVQGNPCYTGWSSDEPWPERYCGFLLMDISEIPNNANIISVGLKINCIGAPPDCLLYADLDVCSMIENHPSFSDPYVLWEDAFNNPLYFWDQNITDEGYWPSDSFSDLGQYAAQDLQDQLSEGWFALGFTDSWIINCGIEFTGGIEVVFTHEPPVANDDSYSTNDDATLDIWAPGVLENDYDPDGDPIFIDNYTQPANGVATIGIDGYLSYTPDAGFRGIDKFQYTISDGWDIDTAEVSITVNPTNLEIYNRLDEIEANTNDILAQVGEMSGGIDYLKEAVGKLDVEFIAQPPTKDFVSYHMGVSYGGLPVVSPALTQAFGAHYLPESGVTWIEITGDIETYSYGDGHIRLFVDLPDVDDYWMFQFVLEADVDGTLFGTIHVENDNFKHWPKP